MANPWYTKVFASVAGMKIKSKSHRDEFALVAAAFDGVKTETDSLQAQIDTALLNVGSAYGTSTSSMSIGLGSKSLTMEAGRSVVVGMSMKIARIAAGSTWMHGDVTAYNSTTGALTVNVTNISGSGGPFTDWAISVSAPIIDNSQTIVAMAALDVDCSQGGYFTKTINGASAFTFSNAPASRAFAFTLELTHTSGAVTWPASVKWPADVAPTLTTGKTHLFTFVTDDGGTRWRGAALNNYVS